MKKFTKLSFSVILIVLLTSLSACYYENNHERRIEGSGPIVSRVIELDDFEGIIVQNSADVYITKGNTQRVEVEAPENIIRNLGTEVTGGVWKIRNTRPVWRMKHLIIKITIPEFNLIKISGSGQVETETPFDNINDLDLRISGSGDLYLNINADDILGRISGSGSIHLTGEAQRVDFSISGSGGINANDLKARKGSAKIGGSGSIRTYVTDDLDARISGSGSITYKGHPRINTNISGSGSIRSR